MAIRSNTIMTWRGMFSPPNLQNEQNHECDHPTKKTHFHGKERRHVQKKERIFPAVLKQFNFNGWHTLFRALLMTSLFSAFLTLWVLSFPTVEAAIYPRNVPIIDEEYGAGSASSNKLRSMTKDANAAYKIQLLGEPNQKHNVSSITSHVTTTKSKPKFNNDDIVFEQLKRQANLNQACKKYTLSRNFSSSVNLHRSRHVIVDDKYKVLFHYVPKVACMTWKMLFTKLARSYNTDDDVTFRTLSDYTEAEIERKLRDYKKVMFVREPLERFLSGYIRKLKGDDPDTKRLWESLYGVDIAKQYRGVSSVDPYMKSKQSLNITLSEFILYVANLNTEAYSLTHSNHWLPVHEIGYACEFEYDFIGHYENLATEAPFVLKWLGIDRIVSFPKVHESKSQQKFADEFKTVSLDHLRQIVSFYKIDYEMFGYSANKTISKLVKKIFSSI